MENQTQSKQQPACQPALVHDELQAVRSEPQLLQKDQILDELHRQIGDCDRAIAEKEAAIQAILTSRAWRTMQRLQRVRLRLVPPGSPQARVASTLWRELGLLRQAGLVAFTHHLAGQLDRHLRFLVHHIQPFRILSQRCSLPQKTYSVRPVQPPPPLQPRQIQVDVIVCVHNALADVQRCLESVVRYTTPPYNLILVDDGSAQPTQDYLADFALSQGALLLRNEQARGYTRAANQGLRASQVDIVVLLNSDTIVTFSWLDRLVACAQSDTKIGLVGPLSNTATWQSIPETFNADGEWAENPLPDGLSIAELAQYVAATSGRVYPRVAFLNGFCFLVKRGLIAQIGYFDEERFGEGYAEENDYCLRAASAGWKLSVADDAYIFHAQSRSYTNERRKLLVARSDKAFGDKHGHEIIRQGIQRTQFDRVMQGCRARSRVMVDRQGIIDAGKRRWEGKRIAFYLSGAEIDGDGPIVFQQAVFFTAVEAMQKMGVCVEMIKLRDSQPLRDRQSFIKWIDPDVTIPFTYIDDLARAADLFRKYDAIVDAQGQLDTGLQTPAMIPLSPTGRPLVTPSVDIDRFRPRRRTDPDWPDRPLRIAAEVRLDLPAVRAVHGEPQEPTDAARTMRALQEISRQHRGAVEIILFGCRPNDPGFRKLERNFPWRHAGVLTRSQMAALLNDIDIFAEFSPHQPSVFNLMAAMACGAAVILPEMDEAGAATASAADRFGFARYDETVRSSNTWIVKTGQLEPYLTALDRLIRDEQFRTHLQQQAIFDICQYYPEKAAYHLLEALSASCPGLTAQKEAG